VVPGSGDDEEVIVPRRYPVESRRKVLDLIEAGKPLAGIAERLGITVETEYNWRTQAASTKGSSRGRRLAGQPS